MDRHLVFLSKHCRLCGKSLKKNSKNYGKAASEKVLYERFQVDITQDTSEVHPEKLCGSCRSKLYRLSNANEGEEGSRIKERLTVFIWKPHTEDGACFCQCMKGRPAKRAREAVESSGTESAHESESDTEKDGCLTFNELLDMLPKLDRELAVILSKKLCDQFNFAFIDLNDLPGTVEQLSEDTLINLTDNIFRAQTENVKKDIASCSQTYKNLPALLNLKPETWMESRNGVLLCAINALSQNSTNGVQKSAAVDQLYSLVQPSFISPFMFAANLLVYSIARSKLATNIYAHILPAGGGSTSLRMWLNRLTMEVPQVPSGDVLTAIDNDQVLIKKWTVRKDNRAQISVLTSVCVAEIDPAGNTQKQKSLAPR